MFRLWFEKLSRFPRPAEPCTVAVPVREGMLAPSAPVCVMDQDQPVPTQHHITALWPDGSVKWLLVHFLADLPPNAGKAFELVLNRPSPTPDNPAQLSTEDAVSVIRTGPLRAELGAAGSQTLLGAISADGFTLDAGRLRVLVADQAGVEFLAGAGERWEVVEPGPVRLVLQTQGRHRAADGSPWLDFAVRLIAYAGKPWLAVEYTVLNREKDESIALTRMELAVDLPPSLPTRRALGISNYRTHVTEAVADEPVRYLIDAEHLLYEANEQRAQTLYGTFWSDWNGPWGGLCVTIHQAHQNFPKALCVEPASLHAELLPADAEPLVLPRGMAKTHRLLLHPHSQSADLDELNVRSLQYQMPDQPSLGPEVYRQADVVEDVWVDRKHIPTERRLTDVADHHARAYGILHWGDTPDPGYTMQGRGKGQIVWTNNEYDFPHAALLAYARTGERRFRDDLLVSARHWMEIDVCHDSDDPLRHQAQITHSAGHVSGKVAVSHEWVQGLLDYYHQTGERFAYDTAIGIGENVLRHLQRPALRQPGHTSARETGWALRSLVALYQETHEPRWLEPAEFIVSQFQDWMDQYGAWLAPYTDHTLIRVPFMISIAITSLGYFHRARPSRQVASLIVKAATDMIENCTTADGRMYYKELPSLQARGGGIITLEALAVAYDVSGQRRFLEAGMDLFLSTSGAGDLSGPRDGGGKRAVDDAVICGGGSSKGFAAVCLALMSFYRAASREGLL